ncbi:uromodulin-like, partial [Clarias magur]
MSQVYSISDLAGDFLYPSLINYSSVVMGSPPCFSDPLNREITVLTGISLAGLVVVTSCNGCHKHAICAPVLKESPPPADYIPATFTCSCTEGFSGNGITCYNISVCSKPGATCCTDGYRWSEHDCVDIDECSGEKSPCTAPLQCKNTPGSFACLTPAAYTKDTIGNVELAANQLSCGGEVCSSGQDCININGALRCADPCQYYTILDDPWRSTDVTATGTLHCDVGLNWEGWYRMYLGNASVQMPERCIQPNTCGTNSPIWLKSPPPSQSEGVVQATVCGSWLAGCCNFEFSIGVKACPGNYYVYKFVSPPLCFLAYAADANSEVCDTCSIGESCVSADKVTWTCKTQDSSPKLICNRTAMSVGVPANFRVSRALDPLSGHLAVPSCSAGHEVNGTVWYEVQSQAGMCGNVLRINNTQAIYSNILYLYPVNISTFVLPTAFPFSCIYPLDSVTSLDLELKPFFPTQVLGLVGFGPGAHASMLLFHDANFTSSYTPGPVTLPVGTPLYVGLNVQDVEAPRFNVVVEDCYITDTADANSTERYYLIQNRCATNPQEVTVNENGVSQTARFTVLLFLYDGNYDEMFLQCHFTLCDTTTDSCSARCQSRTTRSISNHKSITIGPIS